MTTQKEIYGQRIELKTEQREGYFATRTKPFAFTAYGKTAKEAEERAIMAVTMKCRNMAEGYRVMEV